MDTVVSILMNMGVMFSGGNYTHDQVNNFATMYAAPIEAVILNPPLLNAILIEYDIDAIFVIDNIGG
jgi:hypothetical protein